MNVPPAVAAVYLRRGLETPEQVERFCRPDASQLHNPLLLPDIEPALDRLNCALNRGESIHVFGDYDVDGVTATALTVYTLRRLRANVTYRVPHRIHDGYDLRPV